MKTREKYCGSRHLVCLLLCAAIAALCLLPAARAEEPQETQTPQTVVRGEALRIVPDRKRREEYAENAHRLKLIQPGSFT